MKTNFISTHFSHPNWRALCYVVENNKVLLGLKKEGFGKNLWNALGGQKQGNESPIQAAIRETQEEAGVTPKNLRHAANLLFHFANYPDMYCFAFIAEKYTGLPVETAEARPSWFPINQLPFDQMWPDDRHWLPHIFTGKFVTATFWFNKHDTLSRRRLITSLLS